MVWVGVWVGSVCMGDVGWVRVVWVVYGGVRVVWVGLVGWGLVVWVVRVVWDRFGWVGWSRVGVGGLGWYGWCIGRFKAGGYGVLHHCKCWI